MTNQESKKSAARKMIALAGAGALLLGMAHVAGAFGTAGSSYGSETCAYTLQLQTSVEARRDYLVKVDAVLNGTQTAGSTVEDMYGNIVPAAYNDEETGSGTGSISFIFSTLKKSAKQVGSLDSFSANAQAGTLDSFSVACLSCHDGVAASSIQVDVRDRPFDRRSWVNSFTSDHPVGMTYDAYVAANRGYKDVGGNTKMIFVNGKVGCLSCHDPLNTEKGHLVMSDYGSALCQTCHDK